MNVTDHTSSDSISLREVVALLLRHRVKMALFFCAVVALTLAVIALYPRSYSSEAKLLIRVGRETVALDPTATTGQTILLQKTQVDEVNAALDILGSREILQRVVERIGVARILHDQPRDVKESPAEQKWTNKLGEAAAAARESLSAILRQLRLSDPGTDFDLAVRRLEKGVRAWAPKESTVITIKYQAASPELAHDVVAATLDVFLEEHLRLNQVDGSYAFFSEQADTLHRDLVDAQAKLRDCKNDFQLTSLDSRRSIFEAQIQNVELELLAAKRDLAFSEAKVADLTAAIRSLEPELVTGRVVGFANEAKDAMREKLYELELEETRLRSRFTDDHPRLVQIQRQREQAEAILADLPDERTQTTAALNPNQRTLELELIQAKATSEAHRARHTTAVDQLAGLNQQLRAINDQEAQLARLDRELELAETKYRMHVDKLEQARVNDELKRDGITNIKVAQRATFITKPTSPEKRLVLAAGLIVAFCGALSIAALAEALDQTVRSPQQLEAKLGLPVLATTAPAGRRWRRRSRAASEQNSPYRNGNYRTVVRELLSADDDDPQRSTVGVVGCDNSSSCSDVAADVAMQTACAAAGPVLLVDADARRRRVAKQFDGSESHGWRELPAGPDGVDYAPARGKKTGGIASRSRSARQPAPESAVGVLEQADEPTNTDYRLIVLDLPARELEECPAAAASIDQAVLVVEAERTPLHTVDYIKDSLTRAGVRVVGAVVVNRRARIPR